MDATSLLNNIVNLFVVKPTGQVGYIGRNGFVFDIFGDEEAQLDSEITDHYVEGNYAVQDHISLRPPKFTLTGYVGELSDVFQNSFLEILTTLQSMGMVADYSPNWTVQATKVYSDIAAAASQVGMVINQATNVYQTITGANTSDTKQQNAYNYFVQLYMDRMLCTVETPWATWPNMAIESIRVLQRDDNRFVSEFSVSFKQIRKVSTEKLSPINSSLAINGESIAQAFRTGRVADMNAPTSFISGSVAGQSAFDNGVTVNTDWLSNSFSLPTLTQLSSS